GVASAPLGWLLANVFGTGHAALYAVVMASSSAAVILPILDGVSLGGPEPLRLLPQVAVADTACIVAVPLVIDPPRAGTAAVGALASAQLGVPVAAATLGTESHLLVAGEPAALILGALVTITVATAAAAMAARATERRPAPR